MGLQLEEVPAVSVSEDVLLRPYGFWRKREHAHSHHPSAYEKQTRKIEKTMNGRKIVVTPSIKEKLDHMLYGDIRKLRYASENVPRRIVECRRGISRVLSSCDVELIESNARPRERRETLLRQEPYIATRLFDSVKKGETCWDHAELLIMSYRLNLPILSTNNIHVTRFAFVYNIPFIDVLYSGDLIVSPRP
jgi:hypothetical protein